MFARDNLVPGILPHTLLYIPAVANEDGNFDRWVVLNSFFAPQIPLGQSDHTQVFQTTTASNGTKWEVYLNTRALVAAQQGDESFLSELVTLQPPQAAPVCEPGHVIGPTDRILRVSFMKAPPESNIKIERGVSPRAQVLNRARLECQAFVYAFTKLQRSTHGDTTEAMMAGKAMCAAAIAQPSRYTGPNRLYPLKMGAAHHDLLSRHLKHCLLYTSDAADE